MKLQNPIAALILFFISLTISSYSAYAISGTDSIADFDAVKVQVNKIQTFNGSLPSGVAEPKGRFGTLISRIFTADGKIGNRFLKALGLRSDNTILKWSGGYDGQLVNSSITDNGTTVGISGELSVSGNITASSPTTNNHVATKSYVDAAVSGASGVWSKNGSKVYYNGGNVGIGTINPLQKLEIAGNIKVNNGTSGQIYFGPTGHQRLLGDNGAYLYHDSNNDNVSGMIFRDKQYDTYGYVYGSQGDYFGLLDGDGTRSYLTKKDNYTQLRINDIARMHLDTNSMYLRGEQLQIGWNKTGNRYSYIDLVGDDTYSDYGLRLMRGTSGPNTWSEISQRGTGPLYIRTIDAADLHIGTNSATRLTLQKNTGNVGIGTTNPGEKLDIAGNLKTTGIVKANGGVTVDNKTAISGNNYAHTAQSTAVNHYGYFEGRNSSGNRGFYLGYGNGSSKVDLYLDKASELYISGGNVNVPGKIITSTPTAGNHVATKSYVDSAVSGAGGGVWSKFFNTAYYSGGNVAIGTPFANEKLEVNGHITAFDPTADNHVATKRYVDSKLSGSSGGSPNSQTRHNVKASRQVGTTYTNNQNYPIQITFTVSGSGSGYYGGWIYFFVKVNNSTIIEVGGDGRYDAQKSVTFMVPAHQNYYVGLLSTGVGNAVFPINIVHWSEFY